VTVASAPETTVTRLDPTSVELEIVVTEAELEAARERAYRQLVRNARIPGFRPGKAPRKVFEAAYGSDQIEERAIGDVLPGAYTKVIRDNDLVPVEQPDVELLPREPGEPLRFKATVTVRPQIELKQYKGIEVEGPAISVTDADLDTAMHNLQREAASLVPVERPVKEGDAATIDFKGTIDGVPFEGGTAENQVTEIAEARFIPGFAAGIIGMNAGETKTVEAKFPDDYANQELAGKTAQFEVTVHDVKEPEFPALDDDFAKRFHPEGNIEGLRADVKRRLEENAQAQIRRAVTTDLIDKIMDAHEVALPSVMIDRELQGLEGEARSYVERAGLNWDEYLAKREKTEEELKTQYQAEAERRVKSTLLLEAIAKAESIDATQADIDNEVATMARQYGQPVAAIREMLRPNMANLIDGIVRSKVIDFLLDNAVITAAPPAAEDASETAKETKAPAAQSSE
jgi:trigger factor